MLPLNVLAEGCKSSMLGGLASDINAQKLFLIEPTEKVMHVIGREKNPQKTREVWLAQIRK